MIRVQRRFGRKNNYYCLYLVFTSLNTGTRPGPAVARQHVCVCINTQSISSQLISLDVQQCSNEALYPTQRLLGQSPTDLSAQLLCGHEICFVGAH